MIDAAQKARCQAESRPGALKCFRSCPQEFHKRALLAQVRNSHLSMYRVYISNICFFYRMSWTSTSIDGKSAAEPSTLYQLKQAFHHRGVKAKTLASVNATADFVQVGAQWSQLYSLVILFQFFSEACTMMLALKLCAMEDLDDVPSNLPTTKAAQLQWRKELATQIVNFVWLPFPREAIEAALRGSPASWEDERIKNAWSVNCVSTRASSFSPSKFWIYFWYHFLHLLSPFSSDRRADHPM